MLLLFLPLSLHFFFFYKVGYKVFFLLGWMIWTRTHLKLRFSKIHIDLLIIRKNTWIILCMSMLLVMLPTFCVAYCCWHQHFEGNIAFNAMQCNAMPMACYATETSITIEFEFIVIIIVIVVWATLSAFDSIVLQRLSAPAIRSDCCHFNSCCVSVPMLDCAHVHFM